MRDEERKARRERKRTQDDRGRKERGESRVREWKGKKKECV